MDGGGGRRFESDSPYSDRKTVDVDVNVNVTAKEKKELPESTEVKVRCGHGNNVGECLVCYRMYRDKGE